MRFLTHRLARYFDFQRHSHLAPPSTPIPPLSHRERTGRLASSSDPLDLPILFLVRPADPVPVSCLRRPTACNRDARIAGPIAALLAMINGALDGDALFFSREIVIEGGTDAVLAMRNAIDAAEIDLVSEMTALWGPLRPLAEDAARGFAPGS